MLGASRSTTSRKKVVDFGRPGDYPTFQHMFETPEHLSELLVTGHVSTLNGGPGEFSNHFETFCFSSFVFLLLLLAG